MSVLGPPVGSAGTRTGSTESLAKTVDTFSDVPSKGASGWAQAKGPIELSCGGLPVVWGLHGCRRWRAAAAYPHHPRTSSHRGGRSKAAVFR